MSEFELKPCPFCGGQPETVKTKKSTQYLTAEIVRIVCNNPSCECGTPFSFTEQKAARIWNRRA